MTSDRYIPTEAQELVAELNSWLELVRETSEGSPWSHYYGTVAGLRGACDRVLALGLSGPGLGDEGLSGRLRLPVAPESIDKQVGEFRVPDHPGDDDARQQD